MAQNHNAYTLSSGVLAICALIVSWFCTWQSKIEKNNGKGLEGVTILVLCFVVANVVAFPFMLVHYMHKPAAQNAAQNEEEGWFASCCTWCEYICCCFWCYPSGIGLHGIGVPTYATGCGWCGLLGDELRGIVALKKFKMICFIITDGFAVAFNTLLTHKLSKDAEKNGVFNLDVLLFFGVLLLGVYAVCMFSFTRASPYFGLIIAMSISLTTNIGAKIMDEQKESWGFITSIVFGCLLAIAKGFIKLWWESE